MVGGPLRSRTIGPGPALRRSSGKRTEEVRLQRNRQHQDRHHGVHHCAAPEAAIQETGLPIERAAWGVVAAASLGRLDMLRWLLARGLDLDRAYPGVGVLRERAIHNARKDGSEELLRFLRGEVQLEPASTVPPPPPPPARNEHAHAADEEREALAREACDLVRAAGKTAANWNATGPFAPPQRQRLLSHAAAMGSLEVATALLDAGAAPNAVPDGTPPPLTAAAGEAQVEVVKLLLARGALPNGRDGKSWLPLASAAQSGDPQTVSLLLAAGASAKAKSAGGQALVDHARGPFAQDIRRMLEEAR